MSNNASKRIKLWNENPNCYYCKIVTQIYHPHQLRKEQPLDSATLEHLPNSGEVVLACYKCNQEQNTKKLNNIQELKKYLKELQDNRVEKLQFLIKELYKLLIEV